jgi:lysophospholipase L1-like esterase
MKGYVKKIIGRYDTKREGNIKRNQFNTMLKAEYEGKEPIFDLAGIESTYPDGKNETFEKDGRTYYALAPLYTNDGGHLNKTGRKVVAEKLLYFLASLKKT